MIYNKSERKYTHIHIHILVYTYKRQELKMNNLVIANNNQIRSKQEIQAGLFNEFIAYLDASKNTVKTYTTGLKQFFNYLAINGIKDPDRQDVIAYRDELKASGHKPTTVQNYITAVKIFFSWTAQEGYYPNIAERIKGAKLNRDHKKDYLTSKQVKKVINIVDLNQEKGLRDYAILATMITGGLRTIEVSRVNIEDLRVVGEQTVLYVQGKGREEKTEYIKISQEVENAIRNYLKTRDNVSDQEPLFTSLSNNSRGKRLSTRSISGMVKDRLKEAGFNSERLTAHSLRHTAVTLSLLAGKDITEVQQFARHKNIATTMIYNHSLEQAKNSCSEAISKAVF